MDSSSFLRLPGLGHSLWIQPKAQGNRELTLPGDGFSLWHTASSTVESAVVKLAGPAVNLPGQGLSVWLDDRFPQAAPPSAIASKGNGSPPPQPSLRLPGLGHHLWHPSDLISSPLKLTTAAAGTKAPTSGISLPGNGFSTWCHPNSLQGPVRLPGGSHTLWTLAHTLRPPLSDAPSDAAPHSHFSSSPHQPSLLASIMKSFGFAQIIGLLLIIALLLGFLGSRQEAEKLNARLTATNSSLVETKKEREIYLDQVNALTLKAEASAKNEAELLDQVNLLTSAKTGIENTLKTQIANLEMATKAADDATKAVQENLNQVTAASAAKEEELSSALEAAKTDLEARQQEVSKLKGSIDELTQAKSEVEEKLATSVDALQKASDEASAMKADLDQAAKANSDLQKKIDDLQKSLKEKEAEAKKTEEEAAKTEDEVSSLNRENSKLRSALAKNQSALAEFKNVIDRAQPVAQDNTVASAAAVREDDLLRQLEQERKDRQETAEFLKLLQRKVKQIQGELVEAQTANL